VCFANGAVCRSPHVQRPSLALYLPLRYVLAAVTPRHAQHDTLSVTIDSTHTYKSLDDAEGVILSIVLQHIHV
jgi:hypothetical protein